MYSLHGTTYSFTQRPRSYSADCSNNVFIAKASNPFESCVSLVFVLTRFFRFSLTFAASPFLQFWSFVGRWWCWQGWGRQRQAERGGVETQQLGCEGGGARRGAAGGCGIRARLFVVGTVPHLGMAAFSACWNWPSRVIYSFNFPLWFSGDFFLSATWTVST